MTCTLLLHTYLFSFIVIVSGCDWTKDLHPGQESISGGYQDRQLPGPREPRSLLNEPPKPTRIVGDLRNLINSASSARSYSSLYPSSHSSSASYSLSYSSAPPSISATAYAGTSQSSVGRPLPLQRIRMQEERADGSRDTGESRNDLSRVQSIPGAPVAPSCAPNDPGKNPSLFRVSSNIFLALFSLLFSKSTVNLNGKCSLTIIFSLSIYFGHFSRYSCFNTFQYNLFEFFFFQILDIKK